MQDADKPDQLVEHFFRHEYANLVSVLTRAFGFARIDLIEDMVSGAMIQAMDAWKQGGVPQNPAGWIYRVARNRLLDALRREKTHERAIAFSRLAGNTEGGGEALIDRWLDESEIPDSLLRMMFVCCHPTLDRRSQIALTLKILCGFSVSEIARGLLLSEDSVKKRLQRSKAQLAARDIAVEMPSAEELTSRLSAVHDVLYLMFNEGYSTSKGSEPIRDDVCEEAARLCHLLCEHESLSTPESRALLALMLFHASRLDARTDALGNVVLLEDQERSKWNRDLIKVADQWLLKSVQSRPSRFHLEAIIAQLHCAANSFAETDWATIVLFYDRLIEAYPSPIYRLNRAIATAQSGNVQGALDELTALRGTTELTDYYLLDCAFGHVHQLAGDKAAATDAFLAALSQAIPDHQKNLIKKRLERI